jgi:hypothetical protein
MGLEIPARLLENNDFVVFFDAQLAVEVLFCLSNAMAVFRGGRDPD